MVVYNVAQCSGWLYLLVTSVPHLRRALIEGKDDDGQLYRETGLVLRLLCAAALLEIAHAAFGLVKSNPVITGFQVVARGVNTIEFQVTFQWRLESTSMCDILF